MKRIHDEIVAEGDGWLIRCEGKDLHRDPSLAVAGAAAFDVPRTDRNRGARIEVNLPPNAHPVAL
jgi:hypothetical protein